MLKHKIILANLATLAALLVSGSPALAGSPDGKVQLKLLATAVIPDGKITSLDVNLVGVPATSQAKADSYVVPTIAAEYFVSSNFSIETICCVTSHNIKGRGPINGATLVSHARIIPATFSFKYHLPTKGFKPYVGAGPTYFIFFNEKPGATTRTLGATRLKIDSHLGATVQAGFDVPLNEKGVSVSLDAKRYFLKTHAHWYVGTVEALATKHAIDPWVLSAGVAYRF